MASEEALKEIHEAEKGKKKMIRGKRKCKQCGELGHGETSYKCPFNGTKKRLVKLATSALSFIHFYLLYWY